MSCDFKLIYTVFVDTLILIDTYQILSANDIANK